eukprot:4638571-Pyramimonas_sp.AAC.1
MTTCTLGQVRGELKGRLHRWDAYSLTLGNWMVLICIDVLFFFRLGYPPHILKSAWASMFPPGPRQDLVKACLTLVTRTSKHLIPSSQHLLAQLDQDCKSISALTPSPTSAAPSKVMSFGGRPRVGATTAAAAKVAAVARALVVALHLATAAPTTTATLSRWRRRAASATCSAR